EPVPSSCTGRSRYGDGTAKNWATVLAGSVPLHWPVSLSIWKAFRGNTRDLGSFGEETDKTTDLHQHLSRIFTQKLETASQITRDAVTTHTKTASQDLKTASECTTQPIV
ncbi:hypothetical protein Tco_0386780, partial [Tanacetum coccineum]